METKRTKELRDYVDSVIRKIEVSKSIENQEQYLRVLCKEIIDSGHADWQYLASLTRGIYDYELDIDEAISLMRRVSKLY